jgi:L-fuculose-phosphate aldolase
VTPPEEVAREAVVGAAKSLNRKGLSPGRSGNVSVRWRDGMLITASGVAADALRADSGVVFVAADGTADPDAKAPSSEWRFHSAVYMARPGIGAVVHCHSRFATALACARRAIPAFHYMVAKAGGDNIPLVPYATFGTPELAALAARALESRDACLLANHGQIAIGDSLESALELAEEVETLAAQYVAACAAGGPVPLPADEMKRVLEKFKSYGKG